MNVTSITSYILELEKLNEESRTKIEQLKKLLNEANEEKVAALNKLNSLYDTTTRVTQKCVNQGIVDRLLELGEMTSDFYKAGAYQAAANVISSLDYEVESGESVLHINGIGKGIATKIDEYLEEQDSDYEESVASNDYESEDDDDFFISYNDKLADIFDSLSYYEDDEHKAKVYDDAAYNISKLPFKVTNGKELSKGPKKVPGIGKSIAKIIDEFLETGKVKKLENLKSASTNEEIAWALNMCASEESDPHKIRACKRAAEIIGELDFEVTSGEELAKGPHKIEGIGKGIAKKIDEFLQTGRKKCRLYKRDEVVKVAKKYGIRGTEKLSVKELCGGIKMRASLPTNNYETLRAAKKTTAAAKKRAEKKALDKKVATNFMKKMTTRIPSPTAVQRARRNAKAAIQNRVSYEQNKALAAVNQASPRAVMRVARELRRLR